LAPSPRGQVELTQPGRDLDPAYDADRQLRPGVFVAKLTGLLDLTSWPAGMRVIFGKEGVG